MPSSDVTVTAQFVDVYTVTVENGYTYQSVATAGTMVSISANNPASGKKFDKWVSDSAVTFENENSQYTSFSMIAENVTVTATYKDAVATILDHPDFMFDVVFSNGKACSVMEVQYLTAEQKENACGVVFKTEEGKVWVVELGESSGTYAWATGESATTLVGTSEDDGSANMTIFSNNSSEFPLYAYIEGLAGTNAITGEITDWYLPAYSELMDLNSYMAAINYTLGDLGATTLTTSNTSGYWSSSESSATAAYCIKFSGINSLPKTTAVQCKCRAIKVISTE